MMAHANGCVVLMCLAAMLSAVLRNGHCQYQQINLTSISATCNMSSVYKGHNDGNSLGCEGAIDGDTDTWWRPFGDSNANCIFTQKDIYPAYWFLNLQQEHNIHKITIYYVAQTLDYTAYLMNVRVTADGNEIFKYPESVENPQHITDNLPVKARIIKIERTSRHGSNYLPLCQVQLWECEPNRYGNQCAMNCSINCQGNTGPRTCDAFNGTCFNGCKPDGKFNSSLCTDCQAGWYGNDCKQPCNKHCGTDQVAKPCDKTTGRCSAGCEDGWYGDKCDMRCPQNCAGACGRGNGTCLSCQVGYRGPNCSERCSENCDGGCGQYDRRCNNCKAGHWDDECNILCNRGCQNYNCSRDNGQCTCKPGWQQTDCEVCDSSHYGSNCTESCGNCTGGERCHNMTGHCASCMPGWEPPICKKECSGKMYGQNCSYPCGHCAYDATCDTVTGRCPAGCSPGYQGQPCDEACSHFSYGNNCSETCGNCVDNTTCHHVTGSCAEGCVNGFKSDKCTTCITHRWGGNCNESCGNCADDGSCLMGSGECPRGCREGWNGTLCMQQVFIDVTPYGDGDSVVGGVVGGVVAALVVVSVVVVAIVFWRRRQKKATGTEVQNKGDDFDPCSKDSSSNLLLESVDTPTDSKPKAVVNPSRRQDISEEMSFTNDLAVTDQATASDSPLYGNVDIRTDDSITTPVVTESLYGNVTDTGRPALQAKPKKKPKPKERKLKKSENQAPNRPRVYENVDVSGGNISQTSIELDLTTEPSTGLANNDLTTKQPSGDHKTKRSRSPIKSAVFVSPEANASGDTKKAASTAKPSSDTKKPEPSEMKKVDSVENFIREEDGLYNAEDMYGSYQAESGETWPHFDAFQQYLLNCLASGELGKQFSKLPKGMKHPHEVGMTDENNRKNRFKAICAYDYNRVILNNPEGDISSDYINASYIKGCHRDREYIASQGPRSNTVDDHWWMIWQEGITQIVMLTNLKEDGKDKCEEYWPPEGKSQTYGIVTARNQAEQRRADFVIRYFAVKKAGSSASRQVTHYHYIAWPDHGVPQAASLVDFWRYVKGRNSSPSVSNLIHCSAGVGRTGTYIALDMAFDLQSRGEDVNVNTIVKQLREQRSLMVQSEVQYKFLHEVILEAHTSRATRLPVAQFDVIFSDTIQLDTDNARIDKEFEILEQMGQFAATPQNTVAEMPENNDKNRNMNALPDDEHLAYISVPLSGRNQYINAVYLSSFQHRQGFILTQLPLPDTIVDLWRLVDGCDVSTIVSIEGAGEESTVKNYCHYWPKSGDYCLTAGPYTVTLTSKTVSSDHLSTYHLTMKAKPLAPKKEESVRQIEVLHYRDWAGQVAGDMSSLLQLVDAVKAISSGHSASPIIVQCIDGAPKSGLFCALYDVISRVTYDDEVDVYLTARLVQRIRPQAVHTQTQYRYLYKAAQEYIRHLSIYGNADVKNQVF